jgi:polar amino acid transport system substrate-binding protein
MPLHHLLIALLASLPIVAGDLAPTGTLRASFLATNPVQGRVDAKTGAVTGPVADLVRELARRRGVPFQLLPVPDAGAVIDSLKTHRADIGFLAFEAARAEQVDFSEPYALMGNAYLVRADSPIARSADVDRAGVKIAAVKGQSQEIFVSANMKNARVDVLPLMPSADALTKMLIDRTIDAFAANRQRMTEVAQTSTQVRVLSDDFFVIGQAIVVPKGEHARLEELNRFVADVRRSGFMQSSLDRAGLGTVKVAPAK